MSIEIPMRREGQHLVPADAVAAEMMSEIPTNTGVMVTVKVPRNLRQFRLAWALADIVSKSCDWLQDRESAMDWLKIKARHVRMIHDPLRNVTAIVPMSIAFASLDQTKFARVLNRMVYVTVTEIIPGLEESSLRAELEKIVGIDPPPPPKSQPKGGGQGKPPEPLPHSETIAPAAEPQKGKTDVQVREGASQDARGSDHRSEEAQERRAESLPVQTVRELASGNQPESKQEAGEDRPASEPPRAAGPQTEDEYVASCRKWITKQTDHVKALEYYDSTEQIAMRVHLKIKVGVNRMLRRELAEHCAKIKQGATNA